MVYTLRTGPMVYTLFPCFPRQRVYTIGFFCSVTSGSGHRHRKEGCHGGGVPSRPKLLQKDSLQRKCFGAVNFVKITKESLYKANSLACSLAKRDGHASGSNITKKIFWSNYFCNNYKNHYKRKCSKELFCNHFGQDGILFFFPAQGAAWRS